jgi:hypothetical protein
VDRIEEECRTILCQLGVVGGGLKLTSRVKPPDTPQEVVAAGAALVEAEETVTRVRVVVPELKLDVTLEVEAATETVTVIVSSVGAMELSAFTFCGAEEGYIRAAD